MHSPDTIIAALRAENALLQQRLAAFGPPTSATGHGGHLAISEPLFQRVWETAADAMVLSDSAGIVLAVNPAYCRLYGYRAEALVGQSFTLIFSPEERATALAVYRTTFATAQLAASFTSSVQHADGRIREVEARVEFLTSGGQRTAMLSIIRDVTERVQAERSLQETTLLLERIMNTAPDLFYIYDLVEERNVFANRQLVELLGYTPEEVQALGSQLLVSLIHPDDFAKLAQRHEEMNALPDGTVSELEYRMRAADGTWRWLHSRDVVFTRMADGSARQTLGIAQDVTSRKQAEAEHRAFEQNLQATQRLESLGLLAGGIAHDFNNLLVAILGNADLALLDAPPDSPAHNAMTQIVTAASHAAELTRQMLAYAGKSTRLIERLSLTTVVQELLGLLATTVPKWVTLSFDLTPDLPSVEADASQLGQVVLNLVVNAIEASGDQPSNVHIATRSLWADRALLAATTLGQELPAGWYVVLEVCDTGQGMPAAIQAQMFEPFFSTKSTGRGLGLAAVQGIIRSHGGTLWVQSSPALGTAFTILLPAVHAFPQRQLPPPHDHEWQGQGTMLVVDDEQGVREVAARMLKKLGLAVELADDGLAALQLLAVSTERFSGVLLDLTMPQLSGEELVLAMQMQAPSLPIVLMSGYDAQEVVRRFAGQGVTGFLQKPFTLNGLRSVLQRMLSQH